MCVALKLQLHIKRRRKNECFQLKDEEEHELVQLCFQSQKDKSNRKDAGR